MGWAERHPRTWAVLKWFGNAGVFLIIGVAWGTVQRDHGYREGVTTVLGAFHRATDAMVAEGEKDRAAGICADDGQ